MDSIRAGLNPQLSLGSIYSSKSNMVMEIIVNMHYVVVNNQPPLEC